jgi:hypothetical protein
LIHLEREDDLRITGLCYGFSVESTIACLLSWEHPKFISWVAALDFLAATFGTTRPESAHTLADLRDARHVSLQYQCADLTPPEEAVFSRPIDDPVEEIQPFDDETDMQIAGLVYGWPVEAVIALLVRESGNGTMTDLALYRDGEYTCGTCGLRFPSETSASSDSD